jgi:hypothetical protein
MPVELVELIYTSASETLDNPGYGVVSKTEGLPRDLEKFLRQLNRYDYELSAGGDQGHEGPVVFSHTTTQDTSEVWHVLSRVGFGGLDYTQRAVFLAHHVAIRSRDLGAIRVADLLRSPSLFLSRWEGPIGLRPPRIITAAQPNHGRDLWKSVAGHQDWSRNWIDLWSRQNGQACFLITPPGTDVVGLFAGASSLLDTDQANRIDLVSHMDTDRAGVLFDWIGLSAGGKFARSIQGRFAERTMDLSRPFGGSPPSIAPKPPKPTVKAPAPRPVAAPPSAEEYWLEPPKAARESKRSQPRPTTELVPPPPPPPNQMPSRWTRPLMAAGSVVLGLTLIGSGWWFGKNSRVGTSTVAVNKHEDDHNSDPIPSPVPVPPTTATTVTPSISIPVSTPSPVVPKPAQIDGTPADGLKTDRAAKLAEIKPPLKLRPAGKWPLRELVKQHDDFPIAELPADGYSELELVVPEGVGIKVEKSPEKLGRNSLVVISDQGSDQKEKIEFALVAGKAASPSESVVPPKSPASITARYISKGADSDGPNSLIQTLNFCVLRVKPSEEPRLEVIQPVDIYFAPELPAIPVHGSWELADEPLQSGANFFFGAIYEACQSSHKQPLEPKFLLGSVSLSVLPSEVEGWGLVLVPGGAAWKPDDPLNAEFEMIQRGEAGITHWPFALKMKTNFDLKRSNNSPLIGSEVSRKAELTNSAEPKKEGDGSTLVKKETVAASSEKPPDQPQNSQGKTSKPAEIKSGQPKVAVEPPPLENGDVLLEMLKRFGRISGSIVIPLKARTTGQNDGPTEIIEILRFDKGSSAPTR